MKTTGYCYHSVNVIAFGLAQSDHIKRLLLYLENEKACRNGMSQLEHSFLLFLFVSDLATNTLVVKNRDYFLIHKFLFFDAFYFLAKKVLFASQEMSFKRVMPLGFVYSTKVRKIDRKGKGKI
jgi:hypothetical protein